MEMRFFGNVYKSEPVRDGMNTTDLKRKVHIIVERATALKNKYISDKSASVNYACIFSQSKEEYNDLVEAAQKMGEVIKKTPTGLLFQIRPLQTVSGVLKLLKIRLPDKTRPEQGDADFTISYFSDFKKRFLSRSGFTLIKRKEFEMIELMDSAFDVRAYFSNPPLDKQLGIK